MDFIHEFKAAIAAVGIEPPTDIIADGTRQRFSSNGKPRDNSGWYILHGDDRPAGSFGCWRSGYSQKWSYSKSKPLTAEEKAAWRKRMETLDAERKQQEAEAREYAKTEAKKLWEAARDDAAHPYLAKKKIPAIGARVLKDMLLIPVKQSATEFVGLQRIWPDGTKRPIKGTPMAGAYAPIGKPERGQKLVICEGWATGVTIHMFTQLPVIVAFNSGNLKPVVEKLQAKLAGFELVIAADDDYQTTKPDGAPWNPGLEAAYATGLPVYIPRWYGDRTGGTDFNDLYIDEGGKAVAECFEMPVPPPVKKPVDNNVDNSPNEASHMDYTESEIVDAPVPENIGEPPAFVTEPPVDTELDPGAFRAQSVSNQASAAPVDWPEPMDVFGKFEGPQLKREMLPTCIADFVFEQAETIGTDPGIIALSCIVASSALISDEIRVQPKRHDQTWTEAARLWGAIVGDPSLKKSPAMSAAVKPVRKMDMEMESQNAQARAEYEQAEALYKAGQNEFTKKHAKGEVAQKPEKPSRPPNKRLLVEDITVEALSEVLMDNHKGVLCVQDELSGWFGAMDAYKSGAGGKDRANWLEMYNGGGRRIDRVTRGTIVVPNWSACILGGIQPDAIRKIAANMTEDGLMQRFMVVIGRASSHGVDRPADMDVINTYRRMLEFLIEMPAMQTFTLSTQAHDVRERVAKMSFDLARFEALPGGLRSHFGKWEGLFPRILLAFHVIEYAASRTMPPSVIPGEIAEKVGLFMEEFLLPHALAFYQEILDANQQQERIRWVCGYILAHKLEQLSTRDLARSCRWWGKMADWERQKLLKSVVEWGWILPKSRGSDMLSKLPTLYFVNPAVHEVFAKRAEMEKIKRAEIMQIIKNKCLSGSEYDDVDNC